LREERTNVMKIKTNLKAGAKKKHGGGKKK
jgi:hypothetical protein